MYTLHEATVLETKQFVNGIFTCQKYLMYDHVINEYWDFKNICFMTQERFFVFSVNEKKIY